MIPDEALNEAKISAANLIEEIKPLLDEVFFGDLSSDGDTIVYTLPNGQKFGISAKEI